MLKGDIVDGAAQGLQGKAGQVLKFLHMGAATAAHMDGIPAAAQFQIAEKQGVSHGDDFQFCFLVNGAFPLIEQFPYRIAGDFLHRIHVHGVPKGENTGSTSGRLLWSSFNTRRVASTSNS